MDHIRSGRVQVSGSAHYPSTGWIHEENLPCGMRSGFPGGVRVRKLNAGTDYVIGPENASFPHVFASALGGTMSGAVEVKNWRSTNGSSSSPAGHGATAGKKRRPGERGGCRFQPPASAGQAEVAGAHFRDGGRGLVGTPETAIAHFDLARHRRRRAAMQTSPARKPGNYPSGAPWLGLTCLLRRAWNSSIST